MININQEAQCSEKGQYEEKWGETNKIQVKNRRKLFNYNVVQN